MEVTRKNFKETLPLVKRSIDAADFLVIDTEFTGLISGRDVNAFDSPADYYKRLLDGASDFLLIQYGLVAFYWDPASNSYMNDAYNFYVFPRTRPGPERVFLCQSSSLEFLASQGFNFNKLLLEGIPYLTEPTELTLRDRLQERQRTLSQTRDNITVPAENRAQIDNICGQIERFLASTEPESLEIERCNAFVRRLIFQEAGQKFKDSVYIETKILENKDRVLKITRLNSSEESKDKNEERKQKEIEELEEAVGFSRVTKMITESEKLVIGHNMLLDILHTLNQFYQPLPEEYEAFKEFAHCMFPRLLDTKYMSSLPPFKEKVTSSMLPHLLATLSEDPFSVPNVGSLEGRGYSRSVDKSHEAGYDAYITGLCFLSMHEHLARMRGEAREELRVRTDMPTLKPFLNKLYLSKTAHHDSPYMNLAGRDPEPSRDHVFHISFPSEWTRNDIVQMFSPYGPVFVNFLDEASALVSLVRRDNSRAAARSLAHGAPKEASVQTYAQYKNIQTKGASVKTSQWLSKQRMEEYRKRVQVITASKAATTWEPVRSVADDGVSSTTASGFISLKVERKRTQSASSAEAKPSRKRTSSGLFVVDDAVTPQPEKQREHARKEPPEHGEKIERVEIQKSPASESPPGQKERKDSKERKKKTESVSSKKQKTEYEIPETNAKCVSAFAESDNWD